MLSCPNALLTGRLARRLDALPLLVQNRRKALFEAPPGHIHGASRRRPRQRLQSILRFPGLTQVPHDQVSDYG
jgi:hypothetical protein